MIIYAENDCNLSDVNAFKRVEAANMGMFSTTVLSLTTLRTIPLTFANAGDIKGFLLCLYNSSAVNNRSITVNFQENTGSWVTRESIVLTESQIMASIANKTMYGMFVPFKLVTPYTVDTNSNKWQITVQQTGGSTGTWSLKTSDATNPFYVAWSDTSVSFSDNDCPIGEGVVTIDQTATFRGVLGTGDTARSVCGIAVRTLTPTPDTVSRFLVPDPASPITLTLDGLLVLGAHSGFRAGTATTPISKGNLTIICQSAPTYGTALFSGFSDVIHSISTSSAGSARKMSLFLYGEIPAVERTTLASDAAISQGDIVTTDATGWETGDRVYVGKQNTTGAPSVLAHTISAISGTSITLTPNLATANRLAGGMVIRMTGYGITIKSTLTTNLTMYLRLPSNLYIQGVEFYNIILYTNYSSVNTALEDATYRSKHIIKNSSVTMSTTSASFLSVVSAPEDGMDIDSLNAFRAGITGSLYVGTTATGGKSGLITIKNNWMYNFSSTLTAIAKPNISMTGNKFENGTSQVFLLGIHPIFQNNYFWGISGTTGALKIGTLVGGTMGGNHFDKNTTAIYFDAYPTKMAKFEDDVFGSEQANTKDVDFAPSALVDCVFVSPTGNLVIDETYLPDTVEGSHLMITDFNDTAKDDQMYDTYGKFQRCGDGCADTTVRTSGTGKYAWRCRPLDSANLSKWTQTVPTGDIQNKTMTVTVWIKINHANFYAGTHTNPTLRINFDEGTELTSVAIDSIEWQQLAVTFTPTTSYGQITIQVEGATDATGSEAYFYIDDMNVAYPAGYAMDLGGMDLWANAMPITPSIATFPAVGGVWDEPASAHTVEGSFGDYVKKTKTWLGWMR